jgi:creatinine amidohydrolase
LSPLDTPEFQSLQLERLRPEQIEAALAKRSLVYLPLGTIEWHSYHLPVGLDALSAHGLCLKAARWTGGLVHPVLYYGTGGGHGHYPWTVMMPDGVEIRALLDHTLTRLSDFGVAQAVILTGHFADEQQALVDSIAADWADRDIRVKATSVNRSGHSILPDHAGVFETLLLHALHPSWVRLSALGDDLDFSDRHDPIHPIWGVVGADPRSVDLAQSADLLDFMSRWLAAFADERPNWAAPHAR